MIAFASWPWLLFAAFRLAGCRWCINGWNRCDFASHFAVDRLISPLLFAFAASRPDRRSTPCRSLALPPAASSPGACAGHSVPCRVVPAHPLWLLVASLRLALVVWLACFRSRAPAHPALFSVSLSVHSDPAAGTSLSTTFTLSTQGFTSVSVPFRIVLLGLWRGIRCRPSRVALLARLRVYLLSDILLPPRGASSRLPLLHSRCPISCLISCSLAVCFPCAQASGYLSFRFFYQDKSSGALVWLNEESASPFLATRNLPAGDAVNGDQVRLFSAPGRARPVPAWTVSAALPWRCVCWWTAASP